MPEKPGACGGQGGASWPRSVSRPWGALAILGVAYYYCRHENQTKLEYARLQKLGVVFTSPPTATGPTLAAFDDTCGNLIQIYQE